MAEKKYLDFEGLEYAIDKIKELIPLVSYITGLESGKTVDDNGVVQTGSNQITNKVYVEPGMKLHTYGTGSIQSIIRQHLYNEDGSYNGYIDYTAQGDDILNIDRGISIFEEIGGGVTRMYLVIESVSPEDLESAINEIDLHYPTYISTITAGETIDESTGEIISTSLDQYDRTYYLTNKFYATQKFTVNYSAISEDISGQIKVYAYNINDELINSTTYSFVNGVDSLTLTPQDGEYYFIIEVLAHSCSYINVELAVDSANYVNKIIGYGVRNNAPTTTQNSVSGNITLKEVTNTNMVGIRRPVGLGLDSDGNMSAYVGIGLQDIQANATRENIGTAANYSAITNNAYFESQETAEEGIWFYIKDTTNRMISVAVDLITTADIDEAWA